MKSTAGDRPGIAIVGPGRLGGALALNLRQAGWKVEHLVVRSSGPVPAAIKKLAGELRAKVARLDESVPASELVWITVPDDAIADVAAMLAIGRGWRRKMVFHSSGALSSDVLAPLREKGARVASVHPGMTFVSRSIPTLSGVPFAVEGDASALRLARRIIRSLGGKAFTVRKGKKTLYHAFDTFASPLFVALMAAMEEVGTAAGLRKSQLRPMAGALLRQTVENYLEHGAAAAFSGPLVRGDIATIRRHLEAMQQTPVAREAYLALAKVATRGLPVRNLDAVKRELH